MLFSSVRCRAVPCCVLGCGAVFLCCAASDVLCCFSFCCVLLCVVCDVVLCFTAVFASCHFVRCSAASFALVGAVCFYRSFLGVRWCVWLLAVVSWWRVLAYVSLFGCVAGRLVVWCSLPCSPCSPLLSHDVPCRRVVLFCCGLRFFFALLFCCSFSLLFKTISKAIKKISQEIRYYPRHARTQAARPLHWCWRCGFF